MPVILQVNFLPSAQRASESADAKQSFARVIANLTNLYWKVWIYDPKSGTRGGIYLFADRDSAQTWGEGVLRTRLTRAGAANISIRYFEVDEEASAITRAPLCVRELT